MINYYLPLNRHFTELETFHTSCAPGMVNKMNPIPALYSTGNCPKLHYPISVN